MMHLMEEGNNNEQNLDDPNSWTNQILKILENTMIDKFQENHRAQGRITATEKPIETCNINANSALSTERNRVTSKTTTHSTCRTDETQLYNDFNTDCVLSYYPHRDATPNSSLWPVTDDDATLECQPFDSASIEDKDACVEGWYVYHENLRTKWTSCQPAEIALDSKDTECDTHQRALESEYCYAKNTLDFFICPALDSCHESTSRMARETFDEENRINVGRQAEFSLADSMRCRLLTFVDPSVDCHDEVPLIPDGEDFDDLTLPAHRDTLADMVRPNFQQKNKCLPTSLENTDVLSSTQAPCLPGYYAFAGLPDDYINECVPCDAESERHTPTKTTPVSAGSVMNTSTDGSVTTDLNFEVSYFSDCDGETNRQQHILVSFNVADLSGHKANLKVTWSDLGSAESFQINLHQLKEDFQVDNAVSWTDIPGTFGPALASAQFNPDNSVMTFAHSEDFGKAVASTTTTLNLILVADQPEIKKGSMCHHASAAETTSDGVRFPDMTLTTWAAT
eukprot:CAMPEP_0170652824 /NCGR_PEP_ID=MMETSP0224-20130122/47096_1 /TAXON_ID=285029 /ORGANISM="Togula jolla, Strain CCCM 725" /LENGTH=510 /DNA_ID=CAMNT_0010984687 /DNA_START=199 /DNA_END=1727 /DNA_ORIENTATION=-